MRDHTAHQEHDHGHVTGCGHTAVQHEGHTDYLHDGHMHHTHGDHVDEHVVADSKQNPASCESGHDCASHSSDHAHGAQCGHEAVPHAGHTDYLVDGHLHSRHDDHCDDHGRLATG